MPFEKGDENINRGGRPKGSKNKVDGTIKQFLQDMIEGNTEKIEEELGTLKGKAFLDAMFNFMEYVQPKLSRTEVKAEIETKDEIDLSNYSLEDLKKISEDNEDKD